MKRKILVFTLLLIALVLQAQQRQAIRVACIGNSITAGFGIKNPAVDGYPAQLQLLLGSDYEVKNFGVSSRTMLNKGDYPYMNEQAWRDAQSFKPDIAIIKLGTNDSKPENWQYGADFKHDLQQMVTTLLALGSKIYLCTPILVFKPTWNINDSVIVHHIIPIQQQVARQYNLEVIDLHTLFGNDNTTMLRDGIHPNPKGALKMAHIIADIIKRKE
jgi:lysophospholipase L1-like esterase